MKQCTTSWTTLVAGCSVLSIILTGHLTAARECFTCSYIFAGIDGSTDRECVTDVINFVKTVKVQCDTMCIIRTVYTQGFQRLNSLYRGCATDPEFKYGCDPANVTYPTCEVTCKEPSCNYQDGDLQKTLPTKTENGYSYNMAVTSRDPPRLFFVCMLSLILSMINK